MGARPLVNVYLVHRSPEIMDQESVVDFALVFVISGTRPLVSPVEARRWIDCGALRHTGGSLASSDLSSRDGGDSFTPVQRTFAAAVATPPPRPRSSV
jgi:hypothetical protein